MIYHPTATRLRQSRSWRNRDASISFCRLHHLVFSTKNRQSFLRDEDLRSGLHAQIGGISKTLGCAPILTGGVEDHVHLLARFGRTITQAEWIKELKRVSNLWLKKEYALSDFEWQGSYADFSVSASNLEQVKAYIASQEEHHRKIRFQDELRALSDNYKRIAGFAVSDVKRV